MRVLRYFTAESPFGPAVGGIMAAGLMGISLLVLWPPFYWLFGQVFGPWWAYWIR